MAGATGLDVAISSPVTDHAASDDCGVAILGAEDPGQVVDILRYVLTGTLPVKV